MTITSDPTETTTHDERLKRLDKMEKELEGFRHTLVQLLRNQAQGKLFTPSVDMTRGEGILLCPPDDRLLSTAENVGPFPEKLQPLALEDSKTERSYMMEQKPKENLEIPLKNFVEQLVCDSTHSLSQESATYVPPNIHIGGERKIHIQRRHGYHRARKRRPKMKFSPTSKGPTLKPKKQRRVQLNIVRFDFSSSQLSRMGMLRFYTFLLDYNILTGCVKDSASNSIGGFTRQIEVVKPLTAIYVWKPGVILCIKVACDELRVFSGDTVLKVRQLFHGVRFLRVQDKLCVLGSYGLVIHHDSLGKEHRERNPFSVVWHKWMILMCVWKSFFSLMENPSYKGDNLINDQRTRGHLWLVDLAGSERTGKVEVEGEMLKGSQFINKSLSALGDVISALASRARHIPFRNSKLTHMLQNSLGGDCKTLMFVQISLSPTNQGETLCSLNFLSRGRGMESGPARKHAEVFELFKLKQMAEKLKHKEKGTKLQDNVQSLLLRLTAREHICMGLQDKVSDLEFQLEEERNQSFRKETGLVKKTTKGFEEFLTGDCAREHEFPIYVSTSRHKGDGVFEYSGESNFKSEGIILMEIVAVWKKKMSHTRLLLAGSDCWSCCATLTWQHRDRLGREEKYGRLNSFHLEDKVRLLRESNGLHGRAVWDSQSKKLKKSDGHVKYNSSCILFNKSLEESYKNLLEAGSEGEPTEIVIIGWNSMSVVQFYSTGGEWNLAFHRDFKSVLNFSRRELEFLTMAFQMILFSKTTSAEERGPNILYDACVLHLAATLGHDWAIKTSLAAGASINFRDAKGWSALHWAVFNGREDSVTALVTLMADAGALTEPSTEFPLGKRAFDLAYGNAHIGISCFFAESSLTSYLEKLTVDHKEKGYLLSLEKHDLKNVFGNGEGANKEDIDKFFREGIGVTLNAGDLSSIMYMRIELGIDINMEMHVAQGAETPTSNELKESLEQIIGFHMEVKKNRNVNAVIGTQRRKWWTMEQIVEKRIGVTKCDLALVLFFLIVFIVMVASPASWVGTRGGFKVLKDLQAAQEVLEVLTRGVFGLLDSRKMFTASLAISHMIISHLGCKLKLLEDIFKCRLKADASAKMVLNRTKLLPLSEITIFYHLEDKMNLKGAVMIRSKYVIWGFVGPAELS